MLTGVILRKVAAILDSQDVRYRTGVEAQRAPSIVRSPHLPWILTTLVLTGDIRTMARTFSDALDNAFMLDSEVDNLSQSVQQKYDTHTPLRQSYWLKLLLLYLECIELCIYTCTQVGLWLI